MSLFFGAVAGTAKHNRYMLVVLFLFAVLFVSFGVHNTNFSNPLMLSTNPTCDSPPHSPALANLTGAPHHDTTASLKLAPLLAPKRANATFLILCRNSDLDGIIHSVRGIEDRFNREYGYPYVFLNEEPFSEEFKRRLSVLSSAQMEFGVIPIEHWYAPSWIDEEKAAHAREKMEADDVIYGGSVSYRNMCRFNSGFFFRHALLQKYRYYWRVEPSVRFHCDIPSDPFLFMQDNNKTYGFTISMYEFPKTITTLWETVKAYTKANPETIHPDNAAAFVSDDGGSTYNLCHFWSNFEIGDLDFWRGETYLSFFEFLDQAGGFYYERWGDAPVHSIAASLFLPRSSIHFFDEIGYEHPPFTHCPIDKERWANGRCTCDPETSFDLHGYSCLPRWRTI